MSPEHAHTILVLGGIKSGKSEFAEALAGQTPAVRYVATAALSDGGEPDPDWAARIETHRGRRPAHWVTDDIGATPERLPSLIRDAGPTETILVDDLGGWLTALFRSSERDEADDADQADDGSGSQADVDAITADLVAAVKSAAARVIVVSPEVGLSLVPSTPVGRWFADALGTANRGVAAAVDAIALVVAGRPLWLPAEGDAASTPITTAVTAATAPDVADVVTAIGRPTARRRAETPVPVFAPSADAADVPSEDDDIRVGMAIPWADTTAAGAAEERSQRLPVAGAGMGGLTPIVKFVAGVRGEDRPQPFQSVRVIAITGTHSGAIGTGGAVPAWAHPETADASALARLAAATPDVTIELLDTGVAEPIESGDVLNEADVLAAMRHGWRRANAAADRGDDVIVLAAGGPGVEAAAAAVVAGITRGEVPALLPRVFGPDGTIDDEAWMERVVAIRDAVTKADVRVHDGPTALAAFGGPSIATATGLLLGAAQRRTPVILDGPVGAAAALAARDYAVQVRLWCLLTDVAGDPTVRFAADRLGLEPVVSIGLGLGEGANALALLPLFQAALTAAGLADDPLDDTAADEAAANDDTAADEGATTT